MKSMSNSARIFICLIAATGIACMGYGATHWHSADYVEFFCYLAIALAGSGMKIALPGINGTMSVSFLFILLAVVDLGFSEAITLACLATLVQCFWKLKKRMMPVQVVFNICQTALATSFAYYVFHSLFSVAHNSKPLLLVVAAGAYFLANTIPMAVVIALTEHQNADNVWRDCYFWSLPYFLVGASISGLVSWMTRIVGWQTSLLVLPAVYVIFRSYRLYLGKLEEGKRHVEDMSSLHLRTIECLALAIEAKDQTTHDHLQRVRVYALELAKDLELSNDEIEALKAAALLHDIGKLAVPEHIISKPGRLTTEEFEKMKIHPVVGAEILEQVQFPYPVVPIVRAHHEKWDGSGYPYGLKGEEIPIGARILAAVDCLDALASDRQYRRALPLDQAMEKVASEAGTSFDRRVVQILQNRYIELEQMARCAAEKIQQAKLSTDIKIERGAAPAAGFAKENENGAAAAVARPDFLNSIAAASQEGQILFELSHDLGNSLSLDETLSVLSVRLKKLVPYDSIAIYINKGEKLVPEFVSGDNSRLFSSLEVPIGQGLTGWVAHNSRPIINGNPSVEPGYLDDPSRFITLRSALAVPLEGLTGVVGVLALYRAEADAFTQDHLRVLMALTSKVAMSIENALKYRLAESSASTDYLTGLPNSRSLFMHLDREIARCKRSGSEQLAVLVCDLDGFKQVNDRFGHLEGNRVLRAFSMKLRESCREYDYIARMGGDEFVIVAPGLSAEDADEKIHKLETMTRELGQQTFHEDCLSVSVGSAHYSHDVHDADQLLTQADRCMYMTKQQHHIRQQSGFRVLQFQQRATTAVC